MNQGYNYPPKIQAKETANIPKISFKKTTNTQTS